jgi:hypothetical protein
VIVGFTGSSCQFEADRVFAVDPANDGIGCGCVEKFKIEAELGNLKKLGDW